MGGTLPALLRALRPDDDAVPQATGLLYGANTIGAVLGTLATPLLLVPALGIAGLGAAAPASSGSPWPRPRSSSIGVSRGPRRVLGAAPRTAPPGAPLALALYAVAGGVALGYEVVWSELLVPFLSTRAHAFAVMLATYLVGAGPRQRPLRSLGRRPGAGRGARSACCSAGRRRARRARCSSWARGCPRPRRRRARGRCALTGRETVEVLARFVVATGAVVLSADDSSSARPFPPPPAWPRAPPASAATSAPSPPSTPRAGSRARCSPASCSCRGSGSCARSGSWPWPAPRWARSRWRRAGADRAARSSARARWCSPWPPLAALTPRDRLATVLVGASAAAGWSSTRRMPAARWPSSSNRRAAPPSGGSTSRASRTPATRPTSLRYMRLQALLPLLVHRGEPRSALVVGFGTGITAGALLADPELETRVVVELLPSVVRAGAALRGQPRRGDGRRASRSASATGGRSCGAGSRRYDVDHPRAAPAVRGRGREPLLAGLLRARAAAGWSRTA